MAPAKLAFIGGGPARGLTQRSGVRRLGACLYDRDDGGPLGRLGSGAAANHADRRRRGQRDHPPADRFGLARRRGHNTARFCRRCAFHSFSQPGRLVGRGKRGGVESDRSDGFHRCRIRKHGKQNLAAARSPDVPSVWTAIILEEAARTGRLIPGDVRSAGCYAASCGLSLFNHQYFPRSETHVCVSGLVHETGVFMFRDVGGDWLGGAQTAPAAYVMAAGGMSASEQMFYVDAPLAHVISYEDQLRCRRNRTILPRRVRLPHVQAG